MAKTKYLTQEELIQLQERMSTTTHFDITKLNLTSHKHCKNRKKTKLSQHIVNLITFLPNLTHINLSGIQFNCVQIQEIVEHCGTNLKSINLARTETTDTAINIVADGCPNLEHLDVSSNYGQVGDASLTNIATKCKKLTHLNARCAYGALTGKTLQALATSCPELTYLNISNVTGNITDADMTELAKGCKKLQYLNLNTSCSGITDVSLHALAINCRLLTHLDILHSSRDITDEFMNNMPNTCNVLHTPTQTHLSDTAHSVTFVQRIKQTQGNKAISL